MITLKTFEFNPFQENTYILSDEIGECIIIDAGCYAENEFKKLFNYIASNKLNPVRLVNTHGHVDHILGVKGVSDHFGLKPEIHMLDLYLVENASEHAKMFGFEIPALPIFNNFLEEGVNIRFGNSELEVLYVPGHTTGSVAFFARNDNFVITGDVLFKGSIGRTDLPGGDYDKLMTSIFQKLLVLDNSVIVYPGHGPSTTIGLEKINNPFLIG